MCLLNQLIGENSFVGPNQTLIFEVELVDFISMPKPEVQIVPTKNAELIQQYEEQIELYRKQIEELEDLIEQSK